MKVAAFTYVGKAFTLVVAFGKGIPLLPALLGL